MSLSNLRELRLALERKAWSLVAEHPGDDRGISGSWEIRRNRRTLYIDFDGLDDMETLPMERAYACHVRGVGGGLYFRRTGLKGMRRRQLWPDDLAEFVDGLDRL